MNGQLFRPISSFLFVGMILFGSSVSTTYNAFGSGCEPEPNNDPRGIQEVFGPIERAALDETEEAQKDAELKRIAQERATIQRERLEADLRRVTDRLQTSLKNVQLWLTRARIYEQLERREAAVSDLSEAMKLQGESVDLLIRQANLWQDLNEFQKADDALLQAFKLEPQNADIFFTRGKLFQEQWETQNAYNEFSKAIKLDPQHKMARYHRGYILINGRITEEMAELACKDFAAALELDPDMMQARYFYVRAAYISGRPKEAIRQANYVIWDDPKSDCTYLYRCKAYMDLGKLDQALHDATRYILFEPDDMLRYGLRALVYEKRKEYDKAVKDWTKYISVMKHARQPYKSRAKAYGYLGRYEEAAADWDTLVKMEPNNSDFIRFRASAYAGMGKYDEALADIEAAKRVSYFPAGLDGDLENILTKMGEFPRARAMANEAMMAGYKRQNRLDKFEQEFAAEQLELRRNVEEQLARVRQGIPTQGNKFSLHHNASVFKAKGWTGPWLEGLTQLLASTKDPKIQQGTLDASNTFINSIGIHTLPEKETQQAIAALRKLSESEPTPRIKVMAEVQIKTLQVLKAVNEPDNKITEPNCLSFEKFEYLESKSGEPVQFKKYGHRWTESIPGQPTHFYREIKRTPEYIEMFDLNRAVWVRLSETKATTSEDRESWDLISEGKVIAK